MKNTNLLTIVMFQTSLLFFVVQKEEILNNTLKQK